VRRRVCWRHVRGAGLGRPAPHASLGLSVFVGGDRGAAGLGWARAAAASQDAAAGLAQQPSWVDPDAAGALASDHQEAGAPADRLVQLYNMSCCIYGEHCATPEQLAAAAAGSSVPWGLLPCSGSAGMAASLATTVGCGRRACRSNMFDAPKVDPCFWPALSTAAPANAPSQSTSTLCSECSGNEDAARTSPPPSIRVRCASLRLMVTLLSVLYCFTMARRRTHEVPVTRCTSDPLALQSLRL
jgi:hypothetical protein